LERPRQRKMDMRFGTWTTGSVKTAGGLAKCKLDLMAVQEVTWDKGVSHPADDFAFVCGNCNAPYHLHTGFFFLYIRESDQHVRG